MSTHTIREALGWAGVVAVLFAYAALNFGYLKTSDLLYQLLNLFGAGAIGYLAFRKNDMQAATVNFVWGLVALVVLISLVF